MTICFRHPLKHLSTEVAVPTYRLLNLTLRLTLAMIS